MNSLSELRSRPHVSVSALKSFLQCPRKHRLTYIDKVTPAFRPIALAFGTAWHDTIGHWLARSTPDAPVPKEELGEKLRLGIEAAAKADGPPVLFDNDEQNLENVADLGVRMLDAFLRDVPLPEKVLAIELPFSLNLVDPDTGEVISPPLIGAIDAVVVKRGKPTVLELKTSKRKWGADQVAYDLQLPAYRVGARHHGLGEADVELVIVTKAKTPAVQVERLREDSQGERDLAVTAASVLRAVDAGVDHPVRGWACRGCPYAQACR
jgi:CRISPR/Cas system-associated exonuclease Cas4 (RecB family)